MSTARKIPQNFVGPKEYFIYAGPPGDDIRRAGVGQYLLGFSTLEDVEDWIFENKKSHPEWLYQVWKSAGWERVPL